MLNLCGGGAVLANDQAEEVGGHAGRGAEGEQPPATLRLIHQQIGGGGRGGCGGGRVGGGRHVGEDGEMGRHQDVQLEAGLKCVPNLGTTVCEVGTGTYLPIFRF